MSVTVQLQQFEGPLDLLLFLVRREEMDILDINISEITTHYMQSIMGVEELSLEAAGEFIAMAATLLHIKSRMLIPHSEEIANEEESEDPRKVLVRKLLDYEACKKAAAELNKLPLLGRDVFTRGEPEGLDHEEVLELNETPLFDLITAYHKVCYRVKPKLTVVKETVQTIASRVSEMLSFFVVGQRLAMSEILKAESWKTEELKSKVLVSFLAFLELGKQGFLNVFQVEPFDEIYIQALKVIEMSALSTVEEYEALNVEDLKVDEQLSFNLEGADAEAATDEEIGGALGGIA